MEPSVQRPQSPQVPGACSVSTHAGAGRFVARHRWRHRRLGGQAAARRQSGGFRHGNLEPIEADAGTILSYRRPVGDTDGGTRPAKSVSLRARDGRQDRRRRRSLDADLLALCGPGHEAVRQARRHRNAGPDAVHGRSDRHGAGAERFHHRLDRVEQGPLDAQSRPDQRQAAAPAVRRQGGSAQGSPAGPGHARLRRKRRALGRSRAGSRAQPVAHSRQDRPGDHRIPD